MSQSSPRQAGFHMPAEWAPHQSVWSAWPSHAELWEDTLPKVQAEFTELCRAIDAGGEGEKLNILVPTEKAEAEAARALKGLNVQLHRIPFGDIWLRDTAPLFLQNQSGQIAAACFRFNSWGEKYNLPFDTEVSSAITRASGLKSFELPLVLEGGSVELDGEGTCLTTRQCLLNPNRNPGLTLTEIEIQLRDALGVEKILWLGDGLLNDHTDGHIDTVARFVAPGKVVCMAPASKDDPNAQILLKIKTDLEAMTDARGRKLEVFTVPSPGRVLSDESEIMPASYVNFYIGNKTIVVPTYGAQNDQAAVEGIARLFAGRKTVGRSARAILSGGGAFHCITQQQV